MADEERKVTIELSVLSHDERSFISLHEPLITINDQGEELGVFALGIPHTALWIRWRGRNHSIRTADLFKSLLTHIAPRDAERLP